MNFVVDFFESVLKRDHNQKDNPLFKAAQKLQEITKDLNNPNLNDKEKDKKKKAFDKAEENLSQKRTEAIMNLIPQWIENFANKTKISEKPFIYATHLSKFENPSNDYNAINLDQYKIEHNNCYISTSSIKNKVYDIAHSNGNQINLSRFLVWKDSLHETIFEKILKLDTSWLTQFFHDEDKRLEILSKLKSFITTKSEIPNPAQHKQVYFPLNKQNQYHLVSPIISSSFCQFLYEKTQIIDENQKNLKKAKKECNYEEGIYVSYPHLGIINIGGDYSQNISPLNFTRRGNVYLLSSSPPQWQKQNKPPIDKKNIFDTKELSYQAKEPLVALRNLLVAIESKQLSMNLKRKQLINGLIEDIIDILFIYISEIQNLEEYVGWSQKSTLPEHQKYWLDPYRAIADEDFRKSRKDIDWKQDVMNDFAKWIKRKIGHKKLTIGVEQEIYWKKRFKEPFRESVAITDALLEEKINMEPKDE